MFSTDQWIFAAIFLIAFIVILVFSYRKDLRQNRTYFKERDLDIGWLYCFYPFNISPKITS